MIGIYIIFYGVFVVTISVLYLGYTIYNDPSLIFKGRTPTGRALPFNDSDIPTPPTGGNVPDIQVTDATTATSLIPYLFNQGYNITKSIVTLPRKNIKSL